MTAAEAIRKPRTPEELRLALRAFYEEVGPMQRAIAQAIACDTTPYLLHPDGRLTRLEPQGQDTTARLLAALDDYVRAAAARHGLELPGA